MTTDQNTSADEKRLLTSLFAKATAPDVKGTFFIALIPEKHNREDVIRRTELAIQSALPALQQERITPVVRAGMTTQQLIDALGGRRTATEPQAPRQLLHITTLHDALRQEPENIQVAQMMDPSRDHLFADIVALKILWLSEESYKILKLHAPNFCNWTNAAYIITGNFIQQPPKATPPRP